MEQNSHYSACDHINKKQSEVHLNKELRNSLTNNFRVLPIYERALADHAFSKNHSLKNNKFLQCRWLEFQRIHISEKLDPFIFPNVNDYHFYNCDARYKPELSVTARQNNRYSLRIGPGVDKYGEIPIPSDFAFRKTSSKDKKKINKPKLKTKKLTRRKMD